MPQRVSSENGLGLIVDSDATRTAQLRRRDLCEVQQRSGVGRHRCDFVADGLRRKSAVEQVSAERWRLRRPLNSRWRPLAALRQLLANRHDERHRQVDLFLRVSVGTKPPFDFGERDSLMPRFAVQR